jgi:hypothetical protein
MTWLPLWVPFAFLVHLRYGEILPRFPWGPEGGVPIIWLKPGDIGVHLAGMIAYWLLVRPYWRATGVQIRLFWLGWLISFAFVASVNRGAFLSIASVVAVLSLYLKPLKWARAIAPAVILILVMALLDLRIDIGRSRTVSLDQLITNVVSIFGKVESGVLEGTKLWRLMWWKEIVNYTFFGPYFWTGKGCGINLADDDGFQVKRDRSLRSPHNVHLTILARTGVPGFTLWTLFLALLLGRLWLSWSRWRSQGEGFHAGLRLWTFSYLLGSIINGTFDVYIEGPMGGIWFWSMVGFGIGLLLKERRYHNKK